MMDWGVTDKGFRRKTYQDIINSMELKAQDLFGPDIDLSSASPLAIFLRVIAFSLSLVWAMAEKVYYSAFVGTSTGQSLDYAVKYAGVSRRPASHAIRTLEFTGDPGTVIPKGFLVETPDGAPRYATVNSVAIGSTGKAVVLAQSIGTGKSVNVSDGSLTIAVNPIPGISEIRNIKTSDDVDALDRETDRELRERYYLSLAKGGAGTRNAILAAVLEVPGVRTAIVFSNTSMEVDAEGRPPKSVEVVTLGGATEDIAKAIHDTLSGGIEPFGDVEITVKDASGHDQIIRFSRAETVDIYVTVEVTASHLYPVNGDELVREAVISYIGGIGPTGVDHDGLALGQSVIWTALIQAVRTVPGVEDVKVYLGTTSNPSASDNIPLSGRQVAVTSTDKVVVNSAG
ncbi:MAG: hypothetical protein GX977_12320 [Firmicutes bacterium]|nr:hypothetical protein [Bacillota bacterium]